MSGGAGGVEEIIDSTSGPSMPCSCPCCVPGKNINSSQAIPLRLQVRKEYADIIKVNANKAGPKRNEAEETGIEYKFFLKKQTRKCDIGNTNQR
jgi:hypothetical protein